MKEFTKVAAEMTDHEILEMLARIFHVGVTESELVDHLTEGA